MFEKFKNMKNSRYMKYLPIIGFVFGDPFFKENLKFPYSSGFSEHLKYELHNFIKVLYHMFINFLLIIFIVIIYYLIKHGI